MTLEAITGDITKLNVDAIVNAANTSLLGGGGVDGAVHRAAGSELLDECLGLHGCPTGSAKITKGYRLPAKYVIHAVGPVWQNGGQNEVQLLANCYTCSLDLAVERKLKSIAFPCISTGVYRFPKEKACDIAVETVRSYLAQKTHQFEKIIFCCFSPDDLALYQKKLAG